LKVAEMASGTALYRVSDGTWGYGKHTPGFVDALLTQDARRPTVDTEPQAHSRGVSRVGTFRERRHD
jgi:hypothetical protein